MSTLSIVLLVALVWVGIGLLFVLAMCRAAASQDRVVSASQREKRRSRHFGLAA
jgi:hypothetical protein